MCPAPFRVVQQPDEKIRKEEREFKQKGLGKGGGVGRKDGVGGGAGNGVKFTSTVHQSFCLNKSLHRSCINYPQKKFNKSIRNQIKPQYVRVGGVG